MKVLGGCLVIGIFIFIVLVVIGVIIDAFNGENGGENGDTAKAGLGVSRDAVEDAFGDFDFEDAPLKDGRDRLMGDSPGESATLELIGEKDNLEEVALLMTVSSTGGNSEVLRYSRPFITTVLPDWQGGVDWFENGVIELADDSRQNAEVETRHSDAMITLTANKQFGWLTLKVEPAQGERTAQVSSPSGGGSSSVPTDTSETVRAATIAPPATIDVVRMRATPQDITLPMEWLGPKNLLVGALGNGGIEQGKYEYQDDTGNKIVQGDSCFLTINLGTPAEERIQAEKGKPFNTYIHHRYRYVIFEGYDGGCTGDASIDYGLYRVGSIAD